MIGRTVVTKRPETGELVVERTFDASPTTVWRCWTTPEVARWWGPRDWTAVVHEMDVRPGGTWRYSLLPDAGDTVPVRCKALYDRVERPTALGFVDGFADDRWAVVPGTTTPTIVLLQPVGDGTHLTITTRFTDADALAGAEELGMTTGLAEALERLDHHLSADIPDALGPDDTGPW
jgi:uncharacterized protein YndB with AHSA1/START domain